MRILIAILVIFIAAMTANAQVTVEPIKINETIKSYSVSNSLVNTTTEYYTWTAAKNNPCTQSLTCHFVKGTGSHTDMTVNLYGRVFSTDAWVLIASGTTGAITTTYDLTINNFAPNRYREYKTEFTGTGTGTTTLTNQTLKLWIE